MSNQFAPTVFKSGKVKQFKSAAVTTLPEPAQRLFEMLEYRRPAASGTEWSFIEKYIAPLGAKHDAFGNYILAIGASPIMWSCHTDTVHKRSGMQKLQVMGDIISLADYERKSSCLGGDCTTGVWLMAEMIRAGIPGLYVFHREEEIGGHGSNWIAQHNASLFEGIKFAIAFDRKGQDSVITHQGHRTASDAFARSLADILGGTFKPDSTGLFTDTANYCDIIPECTNISVGYERAHSDNETQNWRFAMTLRCILLAADFSTLVCTRNPSEPRDYGDTDYFDFLDDFSRAGVKDWREDKSGNWSQSGVEGFDALASLIERNPSAVADFLESHGFTIDDLLDHAPNSF